MAHLSYPSSTQVRLRLGPRENAILTVVRKCSWWTGAEVEGRMAGDAEVSAVILTAERASDSTIREIMHRSFRLVFPEDGGEGMVADQSAAVRPRRGAR